MSRSPRDEPLLAWRCWRYGVRSGHLQSTIRSTVWIPRRRLTAECLCPSSLGERCRHSPGEDCSCGIYAWLERADLRRLVRIAPDVVPVWGSVSLWGDVIEHERGVRAQHAYPYELFISEQHADHAALLRRSYLCDVVVVPLPEPPLSAWAPPSP